MVTGERGQRVAAMMVGEADRRETADAVKRFCLEFERCCEESSSTERAYAALEYDSGSCQNAKRAHFGLSVSQMRGGVLFFGPGGESSTKVSRVMRPR
jgi:hypothetical protein